METTAVIGYVAGFLTTFAFIPQVWKIWATKSARDVSLHTFIVFTIGIALWVVYGILKQEPPLILWNAVTLVLATAILAMKLKYR